MKKLEKLSINPQKIIKDEELLKFKGGGFWLYCYQEYVAGAGECNGYLGQAYFAGDCIWGYEATSLCQSYYPNSSCVTYSGQSC